MRKVRPDAPRGQLGVSRAGELKGEKGSPHSLLGNRECGDGASHEKGEEGGCHSGNAAEAVQDPRGAPRRIRDARGWRGLGPLSGRTGSGSNLLTWPLCQATD